MGERMNECPTDWPTSQPNEWMNKWIKNVNTYFRRLDERIQRMDGCICVCVPVLVWIIESIQLMNSFESRPAKKKVTILGGKYSKREKKEEKMKHYCSICFQHVCVCMYMCCIAYNLLEVVVLSLSLSVCWPSEIRFIVEMIRGLKSINWKQSFNEKCH